MGVPIVFCQYDERITATVTGDCIGNSAQSAMTTLGRESRAIED